jgi:hypothetical protein
MRADIHDDPEHNRSKMKCTGSVQLERTKQVHLAGALRDFPQRQHG